MKHYTDPKEFKKHRLSIMPQDMLIPKYKIEEVTPNFINFNKWHLSKYNIPSYWESTQGEGIRILMLDTGFPDHKDLNSRVFRNQNLTAEEWIDLNGHQTHCCGIITGSKSGVAPKASIYCDKVLNKNGSGNFKAVLRSLELAISSNFDIISMSLGGKLPSDEGLVKAMRNAIDELNKRNTVVVCSAGNSGDQGVKFPALLENTISIGAHDSNEKIAYFSSKGKQVDFAAPGVNIFSTFLNQQYASLSGTSMACPFIVGVISLMLSKHKKQEREGKNNDCKTPEQIFNHLKRCSIDKGEEGKDSEYGYGLINIKDLLNTKESTPPEKPEEPEEPEEPKEPEKPEQPNNKKDPWIKRNLAWVVCGTFIIIALIFYLTSLIQSKTEVYVPYIDEDGNVDWDKKFEEEKKKE